MWFEEELPALLRYKGRTITGRLLHFAIAKSHHDEEPDASTVLSVLKARADVHGTASYIRHSNGTTQRNDLQGIHIAAGLGYVPAMQVLVQRSVELGEDPLELVNANCLLAGRPFYKPIHDAAFAGSREAICWLLENSADPTATNADGTTALHFYAKKCPDRESDVDMAVRSLLHHKAQLGTRDKKEEKTPLELAATDDSQFPRRLLHLLAPSFQSSSFADDGAGGEGDSKTSQGGHRASFLKDLCVLSGLNTTSANQLARHISDDAGSHKRVRSDAQEHNAVDLLASLIHMAPEAAADMLQLLAVKPRVKDPGRHPIRTRASMWGFPYWKRLRCAYQADCERDEGEVFSWPVWKFDSTKQDDRDLQNQPELRWHLDLVQRPEDDADKREYVVDVDTTVLLVPNILDIDIFMALAQTRHGRIFARLPVQGIVGCLWEGLVVRAFALLLLLNVLDAVVMVCWGLGDQQEVSRSLWSLRWSILASGMVRDVVNMAWCFSAYCAKQRDHYRAFSGWSSDSCGLQRPPGLHVLWRPQNFFTNTVLFDMSLQVSKGLFLWQARLAGAVALDMYQQSLLTTTTIMELFRIFYSLRLTSAGRKINTIFAACLSGAIFEMLLVTFLFFFSVCLAFSMLTGVSGTSVIGLFMYRGLLFGDGSALDEMGLEMNHKDNDQHTVRTFVMVLATLLFNVVLMNLTTAIYSAEYDRLEKEAELIFLQERAKCCCELLLGVQKFRFACEDDAGLWLRVRRLWAVACACVAAGGLQHLLPGAGGGSCLAGAGLLALAQILALALRLQSHWFAWHESEEEGPIQPHFLWICARGDYNEEQFSAELDKSAVEQLVDERTQQLTENVNAQIKRMDAKVGKLTRAMDDRFHRIDAAVGKVLRAQQNLARALNEEPPTSTPEAPTSNPRSLPRSFTS
ncbi:unnamed protein product [Prorocentrum cordatum]|uniref:Ion transport domain-containing protein n=1 Tax=Prorocentrum cordatum TaxID=2364126 RepID=A0ABN9XVG3_9DINO|nr:unnamed protein product [Polarella glacialis]